MIEAILKGGPEDGKTISVSKDIKSIVLMSSPNVNQINFTRYKYNRTQKKNRKTYIFEYEERPETSPDPSGNR